ncbi:MAG: ABC transporter permease [Candidatus Muiribacteriota bacterium]|jgi:peptide/nickel transport system permease protein
MKHRKIVFFLIILLIAFTLGGFFISEEKYNSISITTRFKAPSSSFMFGTDAYGRNLFFRTTRALYNTLLYAVFASGLAILIGFFFGLMSGYFGGFTDFLIQTLIDVMMSFPSFFLILTIIASMPQNGWNVIIAIVLSSWPNIARIIRGEIKSIKHREFILASRSLGASFFRIIFKHIIPNCMNSLIITGIFSFGTAILTESSLSFLNLGIKEDIPTLGNLIAGGRDLFRYWWISFFPGTMLFILIFTVNLFGEYLREKLDPRL